MPGNSPAVRTRHHPYRPGGLDPRGGTAQGEIRTQGPETLPYATGQESHAFISSSNLTCGDRGECHYVLRDVCVVESSAMLVAEARQVSEEAEREGGRVEWREEAESRDRTSDRERGN